MAVNFKYTFSLLGSHQSLSFLFFPSLACDGALNGRSRGTKHLIQQMETRVREAPPSALNYSKHPSDCSSSEGKVQRQGGRLAVTVQLMCVDSADVIYSLFSAPVLTNELQAALWHAADNAAHLLLQVSTRTSPHLTHLNCRHPSKFDIPASQRVKGTH